MLHGVYIHICICILQFTAKFGAYVALIKPTEICFLWFPNKHWCTFLCSRLQIKIDVLCCMHTCSFAALNAKHYQQDLETDQTWPKSDQLRRHLTTWIYRSFISLMHQFWLQTICAAVHTAWRDSNISDKLRHHMFLKTEEGSCPVCFFV